jgi:hypothetical protein
MFTLSILFIINICVIKLFISLLSNSFTYTENMAL